MIGMRPSIAVCAVLALGSPLAGASRVPIDLANVELPQLWKWAKLSDPAICAPLRALKPAELAPRWRGRLTAIRVSCQSTPGSEGNESLVKASATMTPGSVTFFGVPVLRYSGGYAASSASHVYVLRARYSAIAARVIAQMAKACARENSRKEPCATAPRGSDGGISMEINEITTAELYPDPANPAQTLYSWGWAD